MTTTRTYGRYQFAPPGADPDHPRGAWLVHCEPAVMVRAKRAFPRARVILGGALCMAHTIEIARDLEWFMDRFPLEPVDDESAAALTMGAAEHRATEQAIHAVLTGTQSTRPDRELAKTPRPYQQQAVDLLRTNGTLLLTDEVGLGKTLSGVASLAYGNALPALVVAPAHLPPRWTEELTEAAPWLNFHVAKKGTPYPLADKRTGREPDVIIMSYSKLAGWAHELAGKVRTVIFDEVQDLRKGTETRKGIAAANVCRQAVYKLGLTATPVMNYAGEVHSILDIMSPGVLGTRYEFLTEWGARSWNGNVRVADPAALGSYLREQGIMLGRTRAEVGRELPKTIKVTQHVDADADRLKQAAGNAAEMARLILDQNANRQDRFMAAGQIDMLMRQETGIAKAPYVAEFVRLLLESEDKIVLFGWHRAVYELWLEQLAEFRPVLYTGSESPTQKAAAIEAFKRPTDEGGSRILVMSLRSGAGVDGLQKVARGAVFGELDWSPQVHEQAIGRLRRDGMDAAEPPLAYFMVAEEGSDPAIAEVLQVKRQQGEALVSPDGRLFNNAVTDTSRSRMLAEAVLARVAA